ncbi:MAG TPA: amino acid adenylation domain-containing protein [Polyangiaceae bacterium]|jgi:amino acid adenylation domain-containing protein
METFDRHHDMFRMDRSRLPDPCAALGEPRHPTVTRIFLTQVELAPTHPAIETQDRTYSYGELAGAALATAEQLRARGVARGDIVGVLGSRGFEFIAGMLGVLMCGAVLLTMDTQLPSARRRLMLSIARCRFVLSTSEADLDDTLTGIEIVQPPEAPRSFALRAAERVCVESAPDDPAYVFFTSGSTGTPKGVLGCHKGLSHFLTWQRLEFGVDANDRTAHLTGLAFDVVLRDIFLPLTSGATLCIPDDAGILAPEHVLPWLDRARITRLHCVPTIVNAWLGARVPGVTLETMRTIFFAGEPLTSALIDRFRSAFPRAGEIINLYGPTETTLAKLFYRVPSAVETGVQPVGWPLPETQALVLDEENQLAAAGVPGEIVIRTPFRSLGYLNGSVEDTRRFLPNPFRHDATDVVYRTGDRGRYREDGALEILGRLDQQVKIGGVRVEPEEVNAVLARHAAIRSSVVIARTDAEGEPYLVGYLVAQGTPPSPAELRQFLRPQLLEAMIPTVFVFMDAFPLLPNGKLDRRSLPSGLAPASSQAGETRAPNIEESLRAIWKSVLHAEQVGLDDAFLDLGGSSLLALRVIAQIGEKLQIHLGLAAMMRAPTIRELAALLRGERGELNASLVALQPRGSSTPFFCAPCGGGSAFFYRVLATHIGLDQPLYTFEPKGMNGVDEPLDDMSEIAAGYVREMRTVQPKGPYYLGGLSFGGMIAFEMARQCEANGEKVGALVLFDSWAPGHTRVPAQRGFIAQTLERARFLADFHRENLAASSGVAGKLSYLRRLLENRVAGKDPRSLRAWKQETIPALVRKVDVAERKARATYRPTAIEASITLLRAHVQSEEVILKKFDAWEKLAGGGLNVIETRGTHYSLLEEPCVHAAISHLRSVLRAAQAAHAGTEGSAATAE